MKKVALLLIFSCFPLLLMAQESIEKIEIVGNDRVARETIIYYLSSREGNPFSEEMLRRDFKILWSLGYFSNIKMEQLDGTNGKIVRITVEENPIIKSITYKTGKKIKESDIVDKLKEELQLLTGKEILLNIIEIKKPEISATLVAQSIAKQLEGRVNYRRAMKKALAAGMKSGAEGIKIVCSGRLAGAEIARSEKYHDGRVPLHTLRADIDYATATAHTTYGTIGVKVWICKGEIIGRPEESAEAAEQSSLGIKEQPADTRRRRARRKKQGEGRPRSSSKAKPSARELDKSQRRSESPRESRSETPPKKGPVAGQKSRERKKGEDTGAKKPKISANATSSLILVPY